LRTAFEDRLKQPVLISRSQILIDREFQTSGNWLGWLGCMLVMVTGQYSDTGSKSLNGTVLLGCS